MQTCVVAPGAVARNKLPRCAVGVDVREFLLLGPCHQAVPDIKIRVQEREALPRPGRDAESMQSRLPLGLGAQRLFIISRLVAPRREETHLGPCAAHALGRLDAAEPRARVFLHSAARRTSKQTIVAHAMRSMGTYDAVHVRLGDFGSLCAKRPKFCPPSDAELAESSRRSTLSTIPRRCSCSRTIPDRAVSAWGMRVRPVADILNASLGGGVRAGRGRGDGPGRGRALFVGAACSTVSQLIVKRRAGLRPALYACGASPLRPLLAGGTWPAGNTPVRPTSAARSSTWPSACAHQHRIVVARPRAFGRADLLRGARSSEAQREESGTASGPQFSIVVHALASVLRRMIPVVQRLRPGLVTRRR